MKKPKFHTDIPTTLTVLDLKKESKEFARVQALVSLGKDKVLNIQRVSSPKLWRRYIKQADELSLKYNKRPSHSMFFHLTTTLNAQSIAINGFDIHQSKMRAFGRGINLCRSFKDVLNFQNLYRDSSGEFAVIICQGLIGRAHINHSDENKIVQNDDGSYFTKPDFMVPKQGYDSMFSKCPYKKIWIIPSSRRVYPSYIVNIKY